MNQFRQKVEYIRQTIMYKNLTDLMLGDFQFLSSEACSSYTFLAVEHI